MDEDFTNLVEEIEGHLHRYLERSQQEYPVGSQADGVASAVVQRVLAGGDNADFQAIVKLCVFLVENLEDISKTYEDFYSEEINTYKEENASKTARLEALEEENSRLREQLHQRAEELKVRDMTIRSLRGPVGSSKGSLNSSFSATKRALSPGYELNAAMSEKVKEIESLQKKLHAEKMKNREFDEKVSIDDEEEIDDDEELNEEEEKRVDRGSCEELDVLNSSNGSVLDAEKMSMFNRELIKENTELQSRLVELLQENSQYRELSSQLTADNNNLKTATKELRRTVEQLHTKLHADDLLSSQASGIFEQLLKENDRLSELTQSRDRKALADALAADETFEIVGDEEEISDEDDGSAGRSAERQCRHCAKLKDSLRRLEEKHEEESIRIREIVTQNVCMKSELEDWKCDMAEKVRQNLDLSAQLENCRRLLNRLSPTKTPHARGVFGNTLIRK